MKGIKFRMERIDKIISSQGKYSRSEIKKLASQGRIKINDNIVKKVNEKIDIETSTIYIDNEKLEFKKNIYLILNKPKGYISATEDRSQKTVLDLIPEKYFRKGLFPAGRLDKDTTGMMIITDDGEFAHNILSPKKHIRKTYRVTIDIDIDQNMIKQFEKGIVLKDHICCPAIIKVQDVHTALVTITEGKYHQIKRMFGCFGAKVLELHRITMGNLNLPVDISEGCCREITDQEMKLLMESEEI